MPKRYICRGCKNVSHRPSRCGSCGEEMEVVEFPWTGKTFIPYICAGIAGILLVTAYVINNFLIVWATFPVIVVGLIIDHLYQKELDRKAKDKIKVDK